MEAEIAEWAGPFASLRVNKPRPKRRDLVRSRLGLRCGHDADESPASALVLKLDIAGDEGEERVVLAMADIVARFMLRAALANEDGARINELSAEALHSQPLTVRIAAVCRGAAAFLMCHDRILFGKLKLIPVNNFNCACSYNE